MNKVVSSLEELNIEYTLYEHKPVFTVEEAKEHTSHIDGIHCKNLFLRNRSGKQHYLVVLAAETVVDLKSIATLIGSTHLSFASKERLMKYLKLTPGSVSPFGLINDDDKHVKLFIEESVLLSEKGVFHPNDNSASIKLLVNDLIRYMKYLGYEINRLEI